jgi:hypothetical protein
MNRTILPLSLVIVLLAWGPAAFSQETKDTLFYRSLHFTANGMSYWYSQAQGGLESITGVPYEQLSCQNCHVTGCSRCHLTTTPTGPAYSSKAAGQQERCLECHAREASVIKADKEANRLDVHFARGMTCMDCHTVRDVHGDGRSYVSMKETGAMETSCEKCHEPKASRAHTVHGGKLECKACHEQQVVSCTNCHFETQVKEGKRVAIPVSGWLFLMNRDGKTTSANMQSFVVKENKTFLMFAPQHSHSIMKKGRECGECHAAQVLQDIQAGMVKLTWLQDGKVQNRKGVIPVAENVDWEMVYQDRDQGKWVPMPNPLKRKLHYAAYGEPLTQKQIRSLLQVQKSGQ